MVPVPFNAESETQNKPVRVDAKHTRCGSLNSNSINRGTWMLKLVKIAGETGQIHVRVICKDLLHEKDYSWSGRT